MEQVKHITARFDIAFPETDWKSLLLDEIFDMQMIAGALPCPDEGIEHKRNKKPIETELNDR